MGSNLCVRELARYERRSVSPLPLSGILSGYVRAAGVVPNIAGGRGALDQLCLRSGQGISGTAGGLFRSIPAGPNRLLARLESGPGFLFGLERPGRASVDSRQFGGALHPPSPVSVQRGAALASSEPSFYRRDGSLFQQAQVP